jgi:(p)ppGpp synthase/HD superfamily hydrolase
MPYINHPITVVRILAEVGGVEAEDILVAAVLHDTLEDTATTSTELETLFGPIVRRFVEEVSDDKSLPKEERKRLQIAHASQLSAGATLIKLGDKIANTHELLESVPADWSPKRVSDYFAWAEAVIRNCAQVNEALERYFHEGLQEARQKGLYEKPSQAGV